MTNSLEPLSIPACPKLTRRRTLKQWWSFIDRRGEFIRLLKPWRTKRFRYLSTRCFERPALFMRVSDIQEVSRYLSRLGTFKRFALSATSRTSLRNFTEETRALGSWKYLHCAFTVYRTREIDEFLSCFLLESLTVFTLRYLTYRFLANFDFECNVQREWKGKVEIQSDNMHTGCKIFTVNLYLVKWLQKKQYVQSHLSDFVECSDLFTS